MRIAIYGAGSMGTILGAYLTKGGADVELINHNRAHIEALREKGARVTGTVEFTVPVKAMYPDQMYGTYDLIFLMTKQLHNREVVAQLAPHLSHFGVICTTQNGMPEPSIAELVGEDRVLGCTVAWGATLLEPGVSELTSDPAELSFDLGRMNGTVDDTVRKTAEILELMCPVVIHENFMGVRWSKLLINAAFSGMSTVLGCNFGEVADDKRSRRCALRVMKECMDVAAADGKRIEPVQGKDIVKLFNYNNKLKEAFAFAVLPAAIKAHRLIRASMLQDLEKGKLCEIDAIDGVVCQIGDRVGVDTPYCDRIVEIVHGIENGKYTSDRKNIELFAGMK